MTLDILWKYTRCHRVHVGLAILQRLRSEGTCDGTNEVLDEPLEIDVVILPATTSDLVKLMKAGKQRQDTYHCI